MKTKKKYVIVGSALVICAIVIGSTLAWFTWSTSNEQNTNVVVTVGGAMISYEDGDDITNNNLIPTSTKEQGISKNITISSTSTVYLDLNMTVVTLDDGLKDVSFKYGLYDNADVPVVEGNFASSNANDVINLLDDVTITSSPVTYTLYIWIDGTMSNPNTMYNQNFEFRLNANATDEISVEYATETISNIYNGASKTQVTNNSIEYNYATEVSMMEDIGGNIRYYGADPNNYVSFNDELWRIIGVFKDIDDGTGNKETRIKIARSESIGNYEFDNSYNSWSSSILNNLYLNQTFFSELSYENQNMIGDALWDVGVSSDYEGLYADDYYTSERGTMASYPGTATWTGKIALMYASDYMYAGDLSKCGLDGKNWDNDQTNCRDTSWLRNTSESQWAISPTSDMLYVFLIDSTGSVGSGSIYDRNVVNTHATRPVLFLKSNVQITGGDGSQSNPFILSIK